MTGQLQQSADTDQFTHGERDYFSVCLPPGLSLWCDRSKVQFRETVSQKLVLEYFGHCCTCSALRVQRVLERGACVFKTADSHHDIHRHVELQGLS